MLMYKQWRTVKWLPTAHLSVEYPPSCRALSRVQLCPQHFQTAELQEPLHCVHVAPHTRKLNFICAVANVVYTKMALGKRMLHVNCVLLNSRKFGTSRDSNSKLPGINDCPKNCLCSNKVPIDYKNGRLLSQFISNRTGMIFPRTLTGICMKKQKQIARTIKLSRQAGFMPFTFKLPAYQEDPVLFMRI